VKVSALADPALGNGLVQATGLPFNLVEGLVSSRHTGLPRRSQRFCLSKKPAHSVDLSAKIYDFVLPFLLLEAKLKLSKTSLELQTSL
jgi:hypothetical protein